MALSVKLLLNKHEDLRLEPGKKLGKLPAPGILVL